MVLTAFLGIVFPLALLATAYLLLRLIAELRSQKPPEVRSSSYTSPHHSEYLSDVTEKSEGWYQDFLAICESPAEVAFLENIVQECDLKPSEGCLVNNEIALQMQVPVGRFRLDFVINENLNIEIDGAKWHSSPQARERDRLRDKDLKDRGYLVLRIPAKQALYRSKYAISQVREQLEPARRIWLEKQADERRQAQEEIERREHLRQSILKPRFILASVETALRTASSAFETFSRDVHLKTDADRLRRLGLLTPESYFVERVRMLGWIRGFINSSIRSREATKAGQPSTDPYTGNRPAYFFEKLIDPSNPVSLEEVYKDITDEAGLARRYNVFLLSSDPSSEHGRPEYMQANGEHYSEQLTSFNSWLAEASPRQQALQSLLVQVDDPARR